MTIVGISALNIPLDILGGMQYRLKGVVDGLLERGHEVRILQSAESAGRSVRFFRERDPRSVSQHIVKIKASSRNPFGYLQSHVLDFAAIKSFAEGLDLIDSYDSFLEFRSACPVVYSSIYYYPYVLQAFSMGEFRQFYLHFLKCICDVRMLRIADGFIVENSSQLEYLRSKEIEAPCSVIPPYYDEEFLSRREVAMHPIEKRSRNIAYVGRMHRLKGIFELIDALSTMDIAESGWRVLMIGDGPHMKIAMRRAQRVGLESVMTFTGRLSVKEVYPMLLDSQIFVLPSYIEGIPSSLVQAMAAGCACVSTDVGGIGRDIIDHGTNGLLVPRREVKPLAKALTTLIHDEQLRKSLGEKARAKCAPLSRKKFVDDTLNLYGKVFR